MLTITWTYERPNDNFDFYARTPRGSEFQEVIDNLKLSSGLVISYSASTTPDNLTLISTYVYKSQKEVEDFTMLLIREIPTYFIERNLYIYEKSHKLIGISTAAIFRPGGVDYKTYTGELSPITIIPDPNLNNPPA